MRWIRRLIAVAERRKGCLDHDLGMNATKLLVTGGEKRCVGSAGIALLEGAVWLVLLLSLSIKALFIIALIHDRNVVQAIPHATLREVFTEGMRWVPDSKGGEYEVRLESLRKSVAILTQSSMREAARGVFKMDSIASKACFWFYSVDDSTGEIKAPMVSECDTRGARAHELSLETYIESESPVLSGIPISEGANEIKFAGRMVVLGLVIRGQVTDPLTGSLHFIEAGGVALPRQEIVL